jgi:hypothetical protein
VVQVGNLRRDGIPPVRRKNDNAPVANRRQDAILHHNT